MAIPDRPFALLLRCARAAGLLRGLTDAMVQRMGDDLVVQDAPARIAFGHAPGPFRPTAPRSSRASAISVRD